MSDFNDIVANGNYTDIIVSLKDIIEKQAKMNLSGISNLPLGTIRINPTTSNIEKWNGMIWENMILSEISSLQNAVNTNTQNISNNTTAINTKEQAFTKNAAFNKNFGSVSGTVCQGNDSRLSDARTPTSHTHDDRYYTESEANTLLNTKANTSHNHAGVYEPVFTKNTGFNLPKQTSYAVNNDNQVATAGAVYDLYNYILTYVLRDNGKYFSSNGYQKLSNGLVIQWGSQTVTNMIHGNSYSSSFPISFPNACFRVVSCVTNTVSTLVTCVYCPITTFSQSGFSFQYGAINGVSYSATIYYFAIGY